MAEFCDDTGKEPVWLKILAKYWHLFVAVYAIVWSFFTTTVKVDANDKRIDGQEKRICVVEEKAEDIAVIKADISWIKQYLQRR